MRGGWALRGLACLAVVAVFTSGCSDKQEPQAAPPTTTSATASPTLPPLGPADFPVPAEARQKTEAGALAFAKYYLQLSNHLAPTLDSQPLRDLSVNCETCNQLADSFDHDKAAGYHYVGGNVTVASTGSISVSGSKAELSFLLKQEAMQVLDGSGAEVPGKSSPAYELSGGMVLNWDDADSAWLVAQLDAERI